MTSTHPPIFRPRRGIFLADTMIGFTLTAVLALLLVTAITKTHRAEERLDSNATSVRMARRVMTNLQQGGPAPLRIDDAEVKVTPAPGGDKIAGHAWVQVKITRDGRSTTLVGLVPRKAAP